jgi:peptidoglycan-N-acetylglucosamine deacetylase
VSEAVHRRAVALAVLACILGICAATAPIPGPRISAVAAPGAPAGVIGADRNWETAFPVHHPRVVLAAQTDRPLIALTFDLDMTPLMAAELRAGIVRSWVNLQALSYLETNQVQATLFMTGLWAEAYPDLARRLATEPQFEIANHSYTHAAFHLPCYRLWGLPPGGMRLEISRAQTAIARVTGVTPRYFRFPGGCYDRAALDAVHAAGLIPIEWSVNSTDAFNPSAQQIAQTVLHAARPGAIVIMHLMGGVNAPATGAALQSIIPALRARGYQFVTVGELLAQAPAIEPTDPREVVEVYQQEPPPPLYRRAPAPLPVRWCRWVTPQKRVVWVRC